LVFVDCPEAFNEFSIGGGSFDVKLALFEEFVLRVLFHGLNDAGASPEEDSHDFEGWLITIDSENTERVLAHFIIHALQEPVQ